MIFIVFNFSQQKSAIFINGGINVDITILIQQGIKPAE